MNSVNGKLPENKVLEVSRGTTVLNVAPSLNHRKLAKELVLFMFSDDAPGMPFYLPNRLVVRNELEQYERSLQARDYQEVRTPLLMNERLWHDLVDCKIRADIDDRSEKIVTSMTTGSR